MRLRQGWHMRWPHSSSADFDRGMSSDRQVVHVTARCGTFDAGGGEPKNADKMPLLFFLLCEDGPWFLTSGDLVDSAAREALDVGIVVCRLFLTAGRTNATLCFLCFVDFVLGVMDALSVSALGASHVCWTSTGGQRSSGHSSASSASLSMSLATGIPYVRLFSSDSLLCPRGRIISTPMCS